MSRRNSTGPRPVLASAVDWKSGGGLIPAVRLAGTHSTVYVGPDDLPRLENAVRAVRARLDVINARERQDAQQAQEVGS